MKMENNQVTSSVNAVLPGFPGPEADIRVQAKSYLMYRIGMCASFYFVVSLMGH